MKKLYIKLDILLSDIYEVDFYILEEELERDVYGDMIIEEEKESNFSYDERRGLGVYRRLLELRNRLSKRDVEELEIEYEYIVKEC